MKKSHGREVHNKNHAKKKWPINIYIFSNEFVLRSGPRHSEKKQPKHAAPIVICVI